MFQNEALSLLVKSGPLSGRRFNNLTEYMDARHEFEETCSHDEVRRAEVVSGINTKQPHHTVATVCKRCGKVLTAIRVPVSHKQALVLRGSAE